MAQAVLPSELSASYTRDRPGPRPSPHSWSAASNISCCSRLPRMRMTAGRRVGRRAGRCAGEVRRQAWDVLLGPGGTDSSPAAQRSFQASRRLPRAPVLRSVRWPPRLLRSQGTGGMSMGRYWGRKTSTICARVCVVCVWYECAGPGVRREGLPAGKGQHSVGARREGHWALHHTTPCPQLTRAGQAAQHSKGGEPGASPQPHEPQSPTLPRTPTPPHLVRLDLGHYLLVCGQQPILLPHACGRSGHSRHSGQAGGRREA